MQVSEPSDGELDKEFLPWARGICAFPLSSHRPQGYEHGHKSRKMLSIRHVYIPGFILLTNPPSKNLVQDVAEEGVELQKP